MHWRNKTFSVVLLITIAMFASGCAASEWSGNSGSVNGAADKQVMNTDARRSELLSKLDETAEAMYNAVRQRDLPQAREQVKRVSEIVTQITFNGITTIEGAEALIAAVTTTKELLSSVKIEPERLETAAAQVRLATDALIHPNQPMWYEYYSIMQDDTAQLKEAIHKGQNLLASVQGLQAHYTVIRPAVLIAREPELHVKIESFLSFFMQHANKPESGMIGAVDQLTMAWDELFARSNVSAYLPLEGTRNPLYWSLVIGSIIITTLCFAAWRRYRYEQAAGPEKPPFRHE